MFNIKSDFVTILLNDGKKVNRQNKLMKQMNKKKNKQFIGEHSNIAQSKSRVGGGVTNIRAKYRKGVGGEQ